MLPLRDAHTDRSLPLATWALALACTLVYVHQALLGASMQGFLFTVRYGFIPERLAQHPLAGAPTLVTSLFLHGSLLHLLGNMLFLVVFADNIEARLGSLRFLAFYLVGGVAANLAYALMTGAGRIPLVGASGAISAVLGAYLLLYPRLRVLTFIPPFLLPWLLLSLFTRVPRFFLLWFPAWLFIGYWFLVQLLEAVFGVSLAGGPSAVAWWAHVGGFLFGVVTITWFTRRAPRLRWR
ncbi:MAG TPA: rhomboid family intramembrane serine protease [Trueperaceae bacterium]|nr:rhomboid family intramembrane serine protease [Trueperaceae bacterium]